MLFAERALKGALHKIIGSHRIPSEYSRVAPQPRDFPLEHFTEIAQIPASFPRYWSRQQRCGALLELRGNRSGLALIWINPPSTAAAESLKALLRSKE